MANLAMVQRASELRSLPERSRYAPLPLERLQGVLPEGLSRGSVGEIHGARSSGRTALCLHILGEATRRGEICAVIDLYDSFHPASAESAGVALGRIVWVRCQGNGEAALRAADLLLHAGGFGIVVLDLCDASPRQLNRIPVSYWQRFRRTVENTPTALLTCIDKPIAKSFSNINLQTTSDVFSWTLKKPPVLLEGLGVKVFSPQARPQALFLKAVG